MHGLGVYKGIEKITVEGVEKDYIKIEYAGNSNLYVLATQLDRLQKYAASDTEKKPKLNKLGSVEWNKTKAKVHGAVEEIAKDLVELYSIRQNQKGYAFGPDTVWQKEFEEMFPYEETDDQLNAIADTKADMESTRIMDRLICGDVGYGKTEVAIRAAFKAVQEGKQVAYLVPTTILAQQHFNTFEQRMKNFPLKVAQLSSFRTNKEIKETLADLKKGFVDVVIGTHRLLSKDVEFKDLGLLIIDEEQRFGVAHKEKIKKLKNNIDVLTLSATPIPRTLHMSLAGIRDMSVLEEPPVDRVPIQTFVTEHNDEMIREAITRELARNGQVYYVYNRVRSIDEAAAHIQELVPDANVAYAHGQMAKRELEKIMCDFVNGEIDVLVSTTIIETGMDISNCNTMIIEDADRFGFGDARGELAQCLRHQAGLQSHLGIAHLPFDFRLGRQSRHGVDDDDVDGARADQRVGDFERLLAVVGLRNEQVVDVHAQFLRVEAVESVLGVDERRDASGFLRLGDGVDRQGRLARGFGTVNLDDASFGVTAYAERHVQGDRTRGDYLYVGDLCARHAHDRAFAEILLDLLHHRVKYL